MRDHCHCNRKRLAREGGLALPRPGRSPGGAKINAMKPASSNMPSDWYPEKSCAAATNERKHTKHTSSEARGQRFTTTRIDAMIASQTTSINARSLAPNHSRVGANQKRCAWNDDAPTACR